MKSVLIILASFNGENYIEDQIKSILSQEGVFVRVKVFDDCSNDNTVNIIESISSIDDRIELIMNPIQSGSAANNFMNALKSLSYKEFSNCQYIAFSDQDDIWLPNKLIVSIDSLVAQKSTLYMSNLILWNQRFNKKYLIKKNFNQKKYDYLFEGGSAGCTYVFKSSFGLYLKNILDKTDYYNWKYFSHDWFVYFVARYNRFKVYIDGNANILYRIHDSNVHGQLNSNSFNSFNVRLKLISSGWYFENIDGFSKILNHNSDEYRIYKLYKTSFIHRLCVLIRYNFDLIRSKKKYFLFFLVSLIPIYKSRKNILDL